jgi:hypothetical protein
MSEKLVLIPWEEYHQLKERLVGGSPPKPSTPPPDVAARIEPVKTEPNPTSEESTKLPDTAPPGVLAQEWLTWT